MLRAVVLAGLAVALVVLGERGTLARWAQAAHDQLNLDAGRSLFRYVIDLVLCGWEPSTSS